MTENDHLRQQLEAAWDPLPNTEALEGEYFDADSGFQTLIKKIVKETKLPKPHDFTTLTEFLEALSQTIGQLIPFNQTGDGLSKVTEQITQVNALSLVDTSKLRQAIVATNYDKLDCKLPTATLAYLLNWYFFVHQWPLEVGLLTTVSTPHVHLLVRPKGALPQTDFWNVPTGEYILIDYLPLKKDNQQVASGKVETYSQADIEKSIQYKRRTLDFALINGLRNVDQRYLDFKNRGRFLSE